ncbi:IgGFc-binding protein-like [Mytilus edulis]|uniref:IgGFc-binding protein-like n=1 Tax=Mytilus edulis TaxID=6550 RepID=UPI0039EEB787
MTNKEQRSYVPHVDYTKAKQSVWSCINTFNLEKRKDNKGKHFIFGFMYNPGGPVQEVFITTDCSCTVNVNVSTPLFDPNFFQTFRLSKHHVSKVTFSSSIQEGPGTLLGNKGIEIKSDEEITVYGVNRAHATADAYTVFPLDTLGDEYYVITWANKAQFMIIATAENTVVKIVIANGTNVVYNSITYTAGMILNITLNMYQTFHVYGGPDYTGTKILSNKPITVISGASCTTIGVGGCDHLSSQMTPVETFGSTFVTFKMANCNTPVHFKIVVSENNTDVNITGEATVTLFNSGDRYSFQITDNSSKIVTSNKPIAVAFFSEGGCGQPTGDPAMVLLQPTQQFAADYTFRRSNNCRSRIKKGGLLLDGRNLSATWRRIDGSNDLRITDINITKGAHSIYHVNPIVTFLAVSTGLANANGYAYSSGQRLAPINGNCTLTITVPGDIIDNDCDGLIDEELQDGIDNDGDGEIDEDLAKPFEEFNATTTSTTATSTTTLPTRTTPSYIKEIVGDNLSTDMVIAGVLSSLFALSCFSTVVYFLKRKLKGKNGQVEDVFSSISSNNIPPVHNTVPNKA